MTHKKHRQRRRLNAQLPDQAERIGSDPKARRKKKKDADRTHDNAAIFLLLNRKKAEEAGACGVFGRPGYYFTWDELTTTDINLPNNPSTSQCQNLKRLASNVLDPLRELSGAPIYVNSAFRSAAVNARVNGSVPNSLHLQGKAADIYSNLLDPVQLKELIEAHPVLKNSLRELIVYPSHLHVAIV